MPSTDLLAPGHRTCAGCGPAITVREVLRATGPDIIVCEATGCMEVTTTPYPESSWKVPWIHVTFENAAAVASGVKAALRMQGNNHTQVIALGGDGGMVDIGFGAVSGALERNEDILIITYDNEAYANTGVQRSGATPYGASTTTSPAGARSFGKPEWKKNLPMIAAAHGCKYVATASPAYPADLQNKIKKAMSIKGAKYLHILAPCPIGWRSDSSQTIQIAKTAVASGMWVLYEIENGIFKRTFLQKTKSVKEYLAPQGRFKHLTGADIGKMQEHVDNTWKELENLEKSGVNLVKIL